MCVGPINSRLLPKRHPKINNRKTGKADMAKKPSIDQDMIRELAGHIESGTLLTIDAEGNCSIHLAGCWYQTDADGALDALDAAGLLINLPSEPD